MRGRGERWLRRGALGRCQTAAARRAPPLNKLASASSAILTLTGPTGLGGLFSLFSADGESGLEGGGAGGRGVILAPGEICMLAS